MNLKTFSTAVISTLLAIAAILVPASAYAESKIKLLHTFRDTPAETPQSGLVSDSAGNLYGVTSLSSADSCGNNGCGTAFKLTPGSGGKWRYSVIHRFTILGGSHPNGSLIFDSKGNLYGVTEYGGRHSYGVVFELSPSGGRWKEKVLYSFGRNSGDLENPIGALTFDESGNLYGATQGGGRDYQGGVFELQQSGGTWKEVVLYQFTGGLDGSSPAGNLVWDSAGNLCGTATAGGTAGDGIIFELTRTGIETVLHSFAGSDGKLPVGGLIVDPVGNIYGTAEFGGNNSCNGGSGCGTVFELVPSMNGWSFNVLHVFDDLDGRRPVAALVLDSSGSLYGTTSTGGKWLNNGVLFKLSRSGNHWTRTVLYSFGIVKDGVYPYAELIFNQQGALYGTASEGGVRGAGTVFQFMP
jgi:uncharacterized repeat protein (TIGR03803 family)